MLLYCFVLFFRLFSFGGGDQAEYFALTRTAATNGYEKSERERENEKRASKNLYVLSKPIEIIWNERTSYAGGTINKTMAKNIDTPNVCVW